MKQHHKLTVALCLIWAASILYGEMFAFWVPPLFTCSWPHHHLLKKTKSGTGLGAEFDVLSWWRRNSVKFPIFSQIAADILAVQASSVASESAFSTSGRVLDPYRSCLTHFMVEVLVCTEQWLKSEIHINEKGILTIEQLLSDVETQDDLLREFEAGCNLE